MSKQRSDLIWKPPEGITNLLEMNSIKEKGKVTASEQWPELPKNKGTGGSCHQSSSASNGTVNQDRSTGNVQRKLNLQEISPEEPWRNLFATNRMAARDMNLTYIAPIIVEGDKVVEILPEDTTKDDAKWKPSAVVYMVGTTPSIGAM